jgi:hypothetical protein|tara:strand:- start:2567 stop:4078 length:1512 start_codon:yes stop_codon:yes gene_type:complete
MISQEDYKNIISEGRSPELVERQLGYLKKGMPSFSDITPARLSDGIRRLSKKEKFETLRLYKQEEGNRQWMKFIPASGASSRMFLAFFEYLEAKETPNFSLNSYLKTEAGALLNPVYINLKKLPFYGTVSAKIPLKTKVDISTQQGFFEAFVNVLLFDETLQYSSLPKALIPFFVDEQGEELTPFEAQLLEAIQMINKKDLITLHFTITKEHRPLFEEVEKHFRERIAPDVNSLLVIEYSYQNRLSDTPFVDENNVFIRDNNGNINFRRGGHGALLENLNLLDTDYVWIKNIDNILLTPKNSSSIEWQQILAGKLLTIQKDLFRHLESLTLEKENTPLRPIEAFIKTHFDTDYQLNTANKLPYQSLIDYLNRPLRVCGMILNKGSKGGGPFWKKQARGKSLQIIEGVELNESIQIFNSEEMTYFNPVMMVCGIKNFKGTKFCLHDFRDEKRFMVSHKKIGNVKIKVLEWPGLWNGGMAEWNTIFIEIPATTFNPVKTVSDLIL